MLRIKAERLRRGWTQTDVAYKARSSAAEVSRIETGRFHPYPGQIKRLVRVFGIGADELFADVDDARAWQ